jgi:hypothetical protein
MTGEATYHSVSVAGVVIDENGSTLVIQRRDNEVFSATVTRAFEA